MQTEVVEAWWPQTAPLSFSDPRPHGDERGGQTFDDPERTSFNVAGSVRLAWAEVTAHDTGHISCRAHCAENLTCSQSPSPGGKQCCSVGGLLRMPKAEIFSPGGPEASHLHTQGSSREGLVGTTGAGITSSSLPHCPRWDLGDLGSCSALSCLACDLGKSFTLPGPSYLNCPMASRAV